MNARKGALPLLAALALSSCVRPETREVRALMGSTCEIAVWDADRARALRAVRAAFAEMQALDALLSTYKPASEISRLNARAGGALEKIDPRTFEALRAAKDASAQSDGAFDPTVGPLLRAWKLREPGVVPVGPEVTEFDRARQNLGWRDLVLDESSGSARLARAGMELDLGGIGKGFAVDRAVDILKEAGVPSALVNFSGNLRAYGRPPRGRAWKFEVRHPREEGRAMAVVEFEEGALSTSGDYERRTTIRLEGKSYTHIVDPKSGRPVEGVASVTVFAPTATEADALSTAAFVMGPRAGAEFLAKRPGVQGLLVGCEPKSPSRLLPPVLTPGWEGRLKVTL